MRHHGAREDRAVFRGLRGGDFLHFLHVFRGSRGLADHFHRGRGGFQGRRFADLREFHLDPQHLGRALHDGLSLFPHEVTGF